MKKMPDPIDIAVGRKIRARRHVLGMSQETLGANLGVTFQQVQKYENGRNRVSASRLAVVARILDLPISHFFSAEDAELSARTGCASGEIAEFIRTDEGRDLNVAFVRIASRTLRRKIVTLTVALAETQDKGPTCL